MIHLLGASAIYLTALQAAINAPTDALPRLPHEAAAKAKSEKVAGDAIEAFCAPPAPARWTRSRAPSSASDMKNKMSQQGRRRRRRDDGRRLCRDAGRPLSFMAA